MRFIGEDGSESDGPWVEPLDLKRGANTTNCAEKTVWAVPTQEGFALQLNSMISTLTLAARLKRVAVRRRPRAHGRRGLWHLGATPCDG